ncbi:hypothetical protein C8R45DRAFT_1214773 [Mycena sanguinolenta]|nr:hypothetical protein C8R45DRAFT_1214773 [Mycena sanguinolenta]
MPVDGHRVAINFDVAQFSVQGGADRLHVSRRVDSEGFEIIRLGIRLRTSSFLRLITTTTTRFRLRSMMGFRTPMVGRVDSPDDRIAPHRAQGRTERDISVRCGVPVSLLWVGGITFFLVRVYLLGIYAEISEHSAASRARPYSGLGDAGWLIFRSIFQRREIRVPHTTPMQINTDTPAFAASLPFPTNTPHPPSALQRQRRWQRHRIPDSPASFTASNDLHYRRFYPDLNFALAHHLAFPRVVNRGALKHSALVFHVYVVVASRVDLDLDSTARARSSNEASSTVAGAHHKLCFPTRLVSRGRSCVFVSRDSHADASPERDLLSARYSPSPTPDTPIPTSFSSSIDPPADVELVIPAFPGYNPRSARTQPHHNLKVPLRSDKAGLIFPVGRVRRRVRAGAYAKKISDRAAVYFAAVEEYLTTELVKLAGNFAKQSKNRICPTDIQIAVANGAEHRELFKKVILPFQSR